MTMFEIPLPQTNGEPFEFGVSLFGVQYTFNFLPNVRGDYWHYQITSPENEVIWTSKAVYDYSLLSRCPHPDKPRGFLWLIDTASDKSTRPTLKDLGKRIRMVYDDDL